MKRPLLIFVGVIAALLVSRETGLINLTLYRSTTIYSSQSLLLAVPPGAGAATELAVTRDWPSAAVGDYRVAYRETWTHPWTRWIPLVKIGESKVTRQFAITSANGQVQSGRETTTIELNAYGVLSARSYAALAEKTERQSFLTRLESNLRQQARRD